MANLSKRGMNAKALAALKARAESEDASVNSVVLRLIEQGPGTWRRPADTRRPLFADRRPALWAASGGLPAVMNRDEGSRDPVSPSAALGGRRHSDAHVSCRRATQLRIARGGGRGLRLLQAPASMSQTVDVHGLTTVKPQPSKSPTFRVANRAPRWRAIAAICASNCEIGRPAARRLLTMST